LQQLDWSKKLGDTQVPKQIGTSCTSSLTGPLGCAAFRQAKLLCDVPSQEINIMPPNDGCPTDDSFERALREYHEQTWDSADFADLPTGVQCDIVETACRIQAANDRLKDLMAA